MSLKGIIKNIFRSPYYFLKNTYKKVVRSWIDSQYNVENYKQIPIIINNYNRLTYLKQLVDRLEKWGYTNINIIDNNSTYPPLLQYYKETRYKVFRLKENKGYRSLWNSTVFNDFRFGYYVYTDPDVLPLDSCGEDFIKKMLVCLKQFPLIEKVGLALMIHDLPDQYNFKKEVLALEEKYWHKKVSEEVYDAPVDTTFALYRPLAKGNAEECPAYRLGGRYGARHLPWYENSGNPSEEDVYYRNRVSKNSAYWSNK